MHKEPPILKMFFCSTLSETYWKTFKFEKSPKKKNLNQNLKTFKGFESGAHLGSIREKKPEAKNLVLLYL
jgi:hypothetical protein